MDKNNDDEESRLFEMSIVAPITPATTPRLRRSARTPQSVNLGKRHVCTSDIESDIESEDEKEKTVDEEEVDNEERVEDTTDNNRKDTNPSYIIDLKNVPDRNIVLPLRSLIHLITKQFMCKSCRKTASKMTFELETFGASNILHSRCICGLQNSASATLRPTGITKTQKVIEGDAFKNRINSADFDLNCKLVLAIQLGGGGRQEIKNLCGMLNLANNPMGKKITEIREMLGIEIMKIANDVLSKNLSKEKMISPEDSNGNKLLAVSNDARWDKRSSGKKYDSMSGCSVMVGNRTKLVIGLEAMSAECVKCTKNIPHTFDNCSHNYDGSAKGMEATGAITLVKRITKKENKCYIRDYVSDDDSSCRAILTHSWRELIENGLMEEEDWPKYNSKEGPGTGDRKPDNGQLPIDHPEMNQLADKGHRNRIYARPFFTLSRQPKASNCGCTSIDAERMKRRMSWTLRLWSGGTFEEFKTAVLAVLEHHFNNHEFCGDWCKAKGATEEEQKENGFRFRCKIKNKEMYLRFKEIHDEFMEDDALRQLHHEWDTNAVEGFNMLITKFLPKNRNFATTIENKVRIHLAMCLLSIGYEEFYRRLFKACGLTTGEYVLQFFKSEDRERQWRKEYRKLTRVKKTRMSRHYKKIKEGREKLIADNKEGKGYSSGMMGPSAKADNDKPPKKKARKTTTAGVCKHCGSDTHSRKSSRLCPKNPKNLARATVEKEGDGIDDDGESEEEKSCGGNDENPNSFLRELAEIESFERVCLDDDKDQKYSDEDDT